MEFSLTVVNFALHSLFPYFRTVGHDDGNLMREYMQLHIYICVRMYSDP